MSTARCRPGDKYCDSFLLFKSSSTQSDMVRAAQDSGFTNSFSLEGNLNWYHHLQLDIDVDKFLARCIF